MPTMIMLCGLPASGKSTFRAKFLSKHPDYVVASSDDHIDRVAQLSNKTYSEVFRDCAEDADAFCRATFREAIIADSNILVDRTNMSAKARRSFLAQLPSHYTTIAISFDVPDEVLQKRLADRAAATGKHIPADVVASMKASYTAPTRDEFDIILEM